MNDFAEKFQFRAHKVSGLPCNPFLGSASSEGVKVCNATGRFIFPFHGMTVDTAQNRADEWILEQKYDEVCKDILSTIQKEGLGYFRDLKTNIVIDSENLRKSALVVVRELSKLDDYKLLKRYIGFTNNYINYFSRGAITFVYEGIISEWLANSLARKYNQEVTEVLHTLLKTDYQSFMIASEDLLRKIKKIKNGATKNKLIKKYLDNFFFIQTSYAHSEIIDRKRVLEETRNINDSGEIQKPPMRKKPTDFKLSRNERLMVNLLKITEIIRDQRKRINLIGMYAMSRFLEEAAKRKNIDPVLAQRIFWFEYKDLLFHPVNLRQRIAKRKFATMIFDGSNSFFLDYNAIQEEYAVNIDLKEFRGTPAAMGKVTAKANVVFGPKDFKKLKSGGVLVAEMTRPDFVPLMRIAGAIITDEGGLTCHAAIVSRELGIPCIVGTKIATRVLKDGDIVEVDANKGVVRIVKKNLNG